MNALTETEQLYVEHTTRPSLLKARRMLASFAVLTSAWLAAGCSPNEPAAAAKRPTVGSRTATSSYAYPSPSPAITDGAARADVFLYGIEKLPDSMELTTIVNRICWLFRQDSSAPARPTPNPNSAEIERLELGYDQLYVRMNGLPAPSPGALQWVYFEEREQCPQYVPRTTATR
jgi:hypothetical protein